MGRPESSFTNWMPKKKKIIIKKGKVTMKMICLMSIEMAETKRTSLIIREFIKCRRIMTSKKLRKKNSNVPRLVHILSSLTCVPDSKKCNRGESLSIRPSKKKKQKRKFYSKMNLNDKSSYRMFWY
jgi:hypothetical protein